MDDYTGKTFGRLTVIRFEKLNKRRAWFCRCACGNERVIAQRDLIAGSTKSCGCLHRELTRKRLITHGGKGTKLYGVWNAMRERCSSKRHQRYKDYGGRGITVCEEWSKSFVAFRVWALSSGYALGLSIDRTNNDGGYSPENCRWATRHQQMQNRRGKKNSLSGFKGVWWARSRNKWVARIAINGKSKDLGRFLNKESAARAYDKAAREAWGDNAVLNFT